LLAEFGFVGILLLAAIALAVIMPVIPFILTFFGFIPRKPSAVKQATYECGMIPTGEAWSQFNFRYYFFAILFVVFDILTVFLYPWAVNIGVLGVGGLMAVLAVFIIVGVGFVYAWSKKAMEWK
jgi:NADH-quinone oxidoreductase subunit A